MTEETTASTRRHIDPHVHCRDWLEHKKATIDEVMRLARGQGVYAIFDMPNTMPPVTTKRLVERRLHTARDEGCIDGYYLYIGATSNPGQLREAVAVAKSNEKVVRIKLYAGRSTGDLSVLDEDEQRLVYRILSSEGYRGAIAVHCEEEKLGRPELWIPERPATWNLAKPPEMEIKGVENQIKFVMEAGFEGHLHICHISTPEAVEIVDHARRKIRISCGSTPHHLTLSTDDMQEENGMMYKVNPPIRDKRMMLRLGELLREGKIDWIETDHAPHLEEKTYSSFRQPGSFMSGIRSLENYSTFIKGLANQGYSKEDIERLTYSNIKNVFAKVVE